MVLFSATMVYHALLQPREPLLMIAALLLAPALLAQAADAGAAPPERRSPGRSSVQAERLSACEALAKTAPDQAYEAGRSWVAESPVIEARYCLAAAAYAVGRPQLAAEQFAEVARGLAGRPKEEQALAQTDAGNAWLLAGDPARALEAFQNALAFNPEDPQLRIDRARAYAYQSDWRRAEEDLNAAIDALGPTALTLTLRAETRLQQGAAVLAVQDAEEALKLAKTEPEMVEALLVRGRSIQARDQQAQ